MSIGPFDVLLKSAFLLRRRGVGVHASGSTWIELLVLISMRRPDIIRRNSANLHEGFAFPVFFFTFRPTEYGFAGLILFLFCFFRYDKTEGRLGR